MAILPLPVAVVAFASALAAQQPLDPAGVAGTRLICGGGELPAEVMARFVELAGGDAAKIVVIPTASQTADEPGQEAKTRAHWQEQYHREVTVLHTRDRAVADRDDFVAPLRTAAGVWLGGGVQSRIADSYLGTRVETELLALLHRGGVVGGTSAGAAIQSRLMITGGKEPAQTAVGFDLVPLGVVDQHFVRRDRQARLLGVLAANPGHFGLGIDERTAVELHGRDLRVLGSSVARLLLAAAAGRPERIVELRAGDRADLVTWQRAARDRAGAPFPPEHFAPPRVEHGALVIVGGGHVPDAIAERFLALAGGKAARIVVVPTAAGGDDPPAPFAQLLTRLGATAVRVFHASEPKRVDQAPNLDFLRTASGVWFDGGRQWRLVDVFAGTAALPLFEAVLARGGVIGGTSAGASIQSEFMVRGNPLGNAEEACEGYERGFGFLPGCAIDQHFLVRHRQQDLAGLIARYPQLIGLGIDESTAAVVQGSTLEVLGASKCALFDVRTATAAAQQQPEPMLLAPGERWDLVAGRKL